MVLSLCVCRLPARFVEPEFSRKFRNWKNEWEIATGNKLNISDGLIYLKTPGHFLPSVEEREKRMRTKGGKGEESRSKSSPGMSDIEALLATEGIPELANDTMNTRDSEGSEDDGTRGHARSEKESGLGDHESVQWLIVKYKSKPDVWTLPFTHRIAQESAFESLMRICSQQIGLNPHLPSMAPIAFREIVSGDLSSRMFYYKAVTPPNGDLRFLNDSEIEAFEWVDRGTLSKKLSRASWDSLNNAIPLD